MPTEEGMNRLSSEGILIKFGHLVAFGPHCVAYGRESFNFVTERHDEVVRSKDWFEADVLAMGRQYGAWCEKLCVPTPSRKKRQNPSCQVCPFLQWGERI